MFTVYLYVLAIGLFILSWFRDRQKTIAGLNKAKAAFLNILPDLAMVLMAVSLIMTFVAPETIAKLMGEETGLYGMFLTSIVGSVTLLPPFVTFPLAGSILNMGAGLVQVVTLVSTLTMVGIITLPLEIRYFGKKTSLIRNGFAYFYSFVVALLMGVILG